MQSTLYGAAYALLEGNHLPQTSRNRFTVRSLACVSRATRGVGGHEGKGVAPTWSQHVGPYYQRRAVDRCTKHRSPPGAQVQVSFHLENKTPCWGRGGIYKDDDQMLAELVVEISGTQV